MGPAIIGNRVFTEMLVHNTGKGYVQGLIAGSLAGLISGISGVNSSVRNLPARLNISNCVDDICHYATEGGNLGGTAAFIYTSYRYGLHRFLPPGMNKTARASIAGALTGITWATALPLYRKSPLTFLSSATAFSGLFAAEHLWAVWGSHYSPMALERLAAGCCRYHLGQRS